MFFFLEIQSLGGLLDRTIKFGDYVKSKIVGENNVRGDARLRSRDFRGKGVDSALIKLYGL